MTGRRQTKNREGKTRLSYEFTLRRMENITAWMKPIET
jgi:hypothetical protein